MLLCIGMQRLYRRIARYFKLIAVTAKGNTLESEEILSAPNQLACYEHRGDLIEIVLRLIKSRERQSQTVEIPWNHIGVLFSSMKVRRSRTCSVRLEVMQVIKATVCPPPFPFSFPLPPLRRRSSPSLRPPCSSLPHPHTLHKRKSQLCSVHSRHSYNARFYASSITVLYPFTLAQNNNSPSLISGRRNPLHCRVSTVLLSPFHRRIKHSPSTLKKYLKVSFFGIYLLEDPFTQTRKCR